jgi:hypothetical protein
MVGASQAEASPYWYWTDDAPVYDAPRAPAPAPKRHHRKRHHLDNKLEKQIEKQASKPHGPLVISVSIEQQKLKVYDANGLFAEAPVSTGMRGHSTPMGVFSIIQKHKWHRSNIYSGAPMPYMQRITWSGVAMHAGVLPGYPASHGCIRMPMAFAIKMWGWTRMGARVIVSPGDVTPAGFSHPLLATKKIVPESEPMASGTPKPVTSSKSDKAAATQPSSADPTAPTEASGLRRSIALDAVRTADASGATVTMSDAAKPATSEPSGPALNPSEANAQAQATSADTAAASSGAPADGLETTAGKAADGSSEQPKATGTVEGDKADTTTNKDQSRAAASGDPAPTPPLPVLKPRGQVAAFVSGKDGKLYVRQDQAPLFSVPVKIAPSDRPLGTHVFTAEIDNDNNVRWSVVSLPESRKLERAAPHRKSRHHKNDLAENLKAAPEPDSAAEALDRLTIPPDALTRLAEGLSNGASLIVSDQGIAAGETGDGTDFIIRLR